MFYFCDNLTYRVGPGAPRLFFAFHNIVVLHKSVMVVISSSVARFSKVSNGIIESRGQYRLFLLVLLIGICIKILFRCIDHSSFEIHFERSAFFLFVTQVKVVVFCLQNV